MTGSFTNAALIEGSFLIRGKNKSLSAGLSALFGQDLLSGASPNTNLSRLIDP
jgi:hypothetical protein